MLSDPIAVVGRLARAFDALGVPDALDQGYLDRWAEVLGVADLLARARGQARSEGR